MTDKAQRYERRYDRDIVSATDTQDADDTASRDYAAAEEAQRQAKSDRLYKRLWGEDPPRPQTLRERFGLDPSDDGEPEAMSVRDYVFGRNKK